MIMMKPFCFAAAVFLAAASGAVWAEAPLPDGVYHATVLRVLDGATLDVRIDPPLEKEKIVRVRLRGYAAPRMEGACAVERAAAKASRRHLQALLARGDLVLSEVVPGDPVEAQAFHAGDRSGHWWSVGGVMWLNGHLTEEGDGQDWCH